MFAIDNKIDKILNEKSKKKLDLKQNKILPKL